MVRDHPDRFMGLGTLPMQDPERAVREMTRGRQELGLTGFMIDDHVNGLTYDHDQFEPVWEAAEGLGAFLLIHQFQHTTVTYRTRKYFLLNSIGNLVDRTITFAAFVYGGVLDRFPGLTICLCHGGGYVPYALDRLDKGWDVWEGQRGRSRGSSQYLRPALLLRHRGLHPPQPAVPAGRGGGRPGHLRDRLAGADDVRRPGRPPRDDGRALRRRPAGAAPRDGREPLRAAPGVTGAAASPRPPTKPPKKPKVFVVQPVMDVGRRALEEIADVEVHDSERMIGREALLAGVRDSDYLWMLGDTPIDEEVMDAAPRLQGIATMASVPQRGGRRGGDPPWTARHGRPARDHEDDLRPDVRTGDRARLASRRGRSLRPRRQVPPGAIHDVPHARALGQTRRDDRTRRDRDRDRHPSPGLRDGRDLHEAEPAARGAGAGARRNVGAGAGRVAAPGRLRGTDGDV